jgi:N utilization substance protein A
VAGFSAIKGVTDELANRLVGEGYLSYDDLSVIEPTDLQEMGGLSEEEVEYIVEQAEVLAEQAERLAKDNPSAPQTKKLFTGRYDQPAAPAVDQPAAPTGDQPAAPAGDQSAAPAGGGESATSAPAEAPEGGEAPGPEAG